MHKKESVTVGRFITINVDGNGIKGSNLNLPGQKNPWTKSICDKTKQNRPEGQWVELSLRMHMPVGLSLGINELWTKRQGRPGAKHQGSRFHI